VTRFNNNGRDKLGHEEIITNFELI